MFFENITLPGKDYELNKLNKLNFLPRKENVLIDAGEKTGRPQKQEIPESKSEPFCEAITCKCGGVKCQGARNQYMLFKESGLG